jgi:hypothetical protein
MKDLHYWTHVVIEGYCSINQEYNRKHGKYVYQITNLDKPDEDFKYKKEPNMEYDPNIIKRPKPPKFCTRRICYDCLAEECQYFAYADAGKDEGKVKVIIVDESDGDIKPVITNKKEKKKL